MLPQSMGSFEPRNLVIQPSTNRCCVCKSCNDFFGRELDQVLARDSFEAVLRYYYGLKSQAKLHELGLTRITFRLPETCGDLSGAKMRLDFDEEGTIARYLAQVRIRNKKEKKNEFLTIDELKRIAEDTAIYDLREMAIVGQLGPKHDLLQSKLQELLEDLGLPFIHGNVETSETEMISGIQIIAIFDVIMQRAIAKIAFNYMSTILETVSQELIYADDFDTVRSFIRSGAVPEFEVVSISKRNLLRADQATHGHLVTLEAGRKSGRQKFIGHVALFNTLTWQVILADNYRGLHYDVDSAHYWDLERKLNMRIYGTKPNLSLL